LKKVLITGATGFIGGYITKAAVDRGWQVYTGVRKNSNLDYIKDLNVEFVELNLNDTSSLEGMLMELNPDIVIHNAGLTKSNTQEELNFVNAVLTHNLAKATQFPGNKLSKFVFMSSLASYGPADNHGQDQINDHCTPKPVTMYGKSKLYAEKLIKEIPNLPYIILRPTAVYGPREKDLFSVFKMVAAGLGLYTGKGNQKLTFIHVYDLAELIIRLAENNVTTKSYFVSDGQTYSPTELNSLIAKNLGKKIVNFGLPLWLVNIVANLSEWVGKISGKVPTLNVDKLHEIKALNWQCDVEALYRDAQYKPQYLLEKGIAETVQWYKKNNWL
jgi:nucleoside-diphosphate-sugar epimerase